MGWQNNVFNTLIIEGSNSGIFIYNGTPGLGTLIGSWASVAGIDPYGNTYPQGLYVITAASIQNASIINATISNAQIVASQLNQSTVFESTVTFDTVAGQLFMYTLTTTTVTLTALTTSWTAPAGTYTAGDIRVWASAASGDGGGSGSEPFSGAGGGGGGYAETTNYPLTPGTVYDVVVPQGGFGVASGTLGNDGGAATFDFTMLTGPSVRASGGTVGQFAGVGGFPVVGAIGFQGGNGGANSLKSTSKSGGGGGAGGPGGQGGNGGQDGPAGTSHGGGVGGAGVSANTSGNRGAVPGGGGSGAGYTTGGIGTLTSGPGGDAEITITFNTASEILVGALSPQAGTDQFGNAFAAGYTGLVTAFHPGSAPSVAETWQQVFLDGGWSNVNDGIKYRLNSDGTVQVFGAVTRGTAFTTGTPINSTHLIPSVYWPSVSRNIGGAGIPNRAGIEVTAAGEFVAEPNGVSCTEVDVSGFYPLY